MRIDIIKVFSFWTVDCSVSEQGAYVIVGQQLIQGLVL